MTAKRKKTKRIAVVNGGGDCPGLNAVIYGVVKSTLRMGWEIYGIYEGFDGIYVESAPNRGIKRFQEHDVDEILARGGTILGTCNKGSILQKGQVEKADPKEVKKVLERYKKEFFKKGFDAMIAIGGDGTLSIGYQLYKAGIPLVGVPKTIDNDLSATEYTFGFDTAVNTVTEALDKLQTTAQSHDRTMVVEVMGRYAGWIALHAGIAGGADAILIPEIPFDMDIVCKKIEEKYKTSRNFAIVVVAEGAKPIGGHQIARKQEERHREVLLGGIGEWVGKEIKRICGIETRTVVLGHTQRGGSPTPYDRILSVRFGAAAVKLIDEEKFGHMVALDHDRIESVHLMDAIGKMKNVQTDSDRVLCAREIGITFGA